MRTPAALGTHFAAEIAEQPALWRALAAGSARHALREAFEAGPVLFVGSGSSFFVAAFAARVARATGRAAFAIAATDAAFDRAPFAPANIVAFSQSGRSADVLAALDAYAGIALTAVTNDAESPIALRAQRSIVLAAGREQAVPATKSVTGMIALVLLAAASDGDGETAGLLAAADAVERWLALQAASELARVVPFVAAASALIVAGSGHGVPLAREVALKCKESTYLRAEGVAAGEFRHGGIAMLDPTCALIVLADATDPGQAKLAAEARRAGALVAAFGGALDAVPALGPIVPAPWTALGWIVAGQRLALDVSRARGIDADAPRGIVKVLGK